MKTFVLWRSPGRPKESWGQSMERKEEVNILNISQREQGRKIKSKPKPRVKGKRVGRKRSGWPARERQGHRKSPQKKKKRKKRSEKYSAR